MKRNREYVISLIQRASRKLSADGTSTISREEAEKLADTKITIKTNPSKEESDLRMAQIEAITNLNIKWQ